MPDPIVDNQTQDVLSFLPDDVKTTDGAKKWQGKTVSDFYKSYTELEKSYHSKQEGMIKIPTSESPEEEKNNFYKALGVPESFDKYEIPTFEDHVVKDASVEKWFLETAHKHKLNNEQFKSIYADYIELNRKQFEVQEAATKTQLGDKYSDVVKYANMAADKLPDDVKKDVLPFVGKNYIVTQILNAFGSKLGESQSPQGGSGGGEGLTDMEKRLKDIEESKEYKQGKNAIVKEANELRIQIIKLKKK